MCDENGPCLSKMIENIPEETMTKWTEFIERVDAIGEEMFPGGASIVIGAQFDLLGRGADVPDCLVTTNVGPCQAVAAVEAMSEFVYEAHRLAHVTGDAGKGFVVEETTQEGLPQHIKDAISKYAAEHGVDPDNLIVQEIADIRDLDRLPTYTPEEGQ